MDAGLWTIVVWFCLWGVPGALIAPRKGISPIAGFVTGGLFAIFGLAFLALQKDEPSMPARPVQAGPDWGLPTRTKFYQPGQEEYFRRDQADAAAHGWHPVARDFTPDGSLRVTYRKQGVSEWA